jgi:diguanylate cyclase (GGDEF)-like protein
LNSKPFVSLEWISLKRDPSTGLGTLVTLFEKLDDFLQTTWSDGKPLSLLHIDVDQMARLNRSLGYASVDELLLQLVRLIQKLIQESNFGYPHEDLLYRMGGDEFAVILPGVQIEQASAFAEAIRHRFTESSPHTTVSITLSVGVAAVPHNAHDLGSLVTAADMGVLEAKGRGGNTVAFSTSGQVGGYEVVVAARIINMLARRMVETGSLLEEAQHAAFTDTVTGLPNQRAMNHFLEQEHIRAVRYHRPYSLLLVDGDCLKKFNDLLTHEAGNEWIRRLSRLLVRQTRSTDLVARWFSGDEFVVILTETEIEEASATAERIRVAVEEEGKKMPVAGTVSIGVATYPHDGATVRELLEHADHANSEAKRLGRNRVVAYGSIFSTDPASDG